MILNLGSNGYSCDTIYDVDKETAEAIEKVFEYYSDLDEKKKCTPFKTKIVNPFNATALVNLLTLVVDDSSNLVIGIDPSSIYNNLDNKYLYYGIVVGCDNIILARAKSDKFFSIRDKFLKKFLKKDALLGKVFIDLLIKK